MPLTNAELILEAHRSISNIMRMSCFVADRQNDMTAPLPDAIVNALADQFRAEADRIKHVHKGGE